MNFNDDLKCHARESVYKNELILGHQSEYGAWANMKQRCLNANNPRFVGYGGRGIGVCDKWMTFEGFMDDMGKKPYPKHTLERLDNDGDYCPENCVWVDYKEQYKTRSKYNIWEYESGKKTSFLKGLKRLERRIGVVFGRIIYEKKTGTVHKNMSEAATFFGLSPRTVSASFRNGGRTRKQLFVHYSEITNSA